MDARQEFLARVDDSINHMRESEEYRKGQGIVVIVAYPKDSPVDCSKVDDIDLDNAEISIYEGDVRDENGNVVPWNLPDSVILYKVSGLAR